MHILKQVVIILSVLIGLITLSSCKGLVERQNIQGIGLLTEGSIYDNDWELKGYEGLLSVGETYDVDVYHKEVKQSNLEVMSAVEELVEKGVNLVFGSSHFYGRHFLEASQQHPNVHFVYLNGGYVGENVTSLNFDSHAISFFSGMIASEMTRTNHIGIIAANEWQTESEGFYEGAKYQNPEIEVHIKHINNLDYTMIVKQIYDQMREKQTDVFYPVGNTFSKAVLEQASEDQLYAIGYALDQSSIDPKTVLMSTIHDLNKVYHRVAKKFNEQALEGGIITFDFQDNVLSLGKFSSEIPEEFQQEIYDQIDTYKRTNLLPNEQ